MPVPKQNISKRETKKRIKIIEDLAISLKEFGSCLILTWPMAYWQDYSVDEKSPIIIHLLTNHMTVSGIVWLKYFQKYNFVKILAGFEKRVFDTFSLHCIIKWVPIECRIWNENTFCQILEYSRESVNCLHFQSKKNISDISYSFYGDTDILAYSDTRVDTYHVCQLPLFHVANNSLFISYSLAQFLSNPIILADIWDMASCFSRFRLLTDEKLENCEQNNGKSYSLLHIFPYIDDISDEVKILLI